MHFSSKLSEYINKINCSYKELAKSSDLSEATISRYCNGTRLPINPSKQLDKLINGLCSLIITYNVSGLNEKVIRQEFNSILKNYDFDKIITNFNELVYVLKINMSEFSKVLGFDASYLSKIRSGKRKPADIEMFFNAICNYVVDNYNDNNSKNCICSIIGCSLSKVNSIDEYKNMLSSWLCSDYKKIKSINSINSFLVKLDEFDLNQYIKAIHFNDLKIPSTPFKIPNSKNYYGIEEMKQGELDFLKSTILSKSSKSVFMCSDMQMEDMASDKAFGKKWMFGIAMILKKGLHLDVIHNIDRPFNEMLLGLESWIPIYMTGQVSPYYFINTQNNIYSHLNYVSDNVILTGECIRGHHNNGKYYLTNNKTEITYFKEKCNILLNKAQPLMKIYTKIERSNLKLFFDADKYLMGNRKNVYSSLPIHTISEDLLLKILKRNNVSDNDNKEILKFVRREKMRAEITLDKNTMQEIIPKVNKNDIITLDLSKIFYQKKITYNYDEYLSHLKLTKDYEKNNKNYFLSIRDNIPFKNIQIFILLNNIVIISKTNTPAIHFIIEHPKLCKAIENFIAPITI